MSPSGRLSQARPLGGPQQDLEGGGLFSGRPARILTLMRLGILPFFMLAALVVYLWARRHFESGGGSGSRPVHAGADGAGACRPRHHRYAADGLPVRRILRVLL